MTTKSKPATGGKSPGGTPSVAYWSLLEKFPLRPLGTAKDLASAIQVIDDLIDRPHLDAWEQAYLDVLSNLVSTAEEQQYPITAASDGDTVRVLCEENTLQDIERLSSPLNQAVLRFGSARRAGMQSF